MSIQNTPFHKTLKVKLSLWFGDRFISRSRGNNVRIKMKDGSNIPITLQLIFAPDRPVRPTLKSIQKSEQEWEHLLHDLNNGKGQKPAQNWVTHIYGDEFILTVSDIHFSFLAKEVSKHVYEMKDFNLQENGEKVLKNEISDSDGVITFERAESLMNYEGTPDFIELIQKELEGQKVAVPLKISQNEGHKEVDAPEQENDISPDPSLKLEGQQIEMPPKTSQNEGQKGGNSIDDFIKQAKAALRKKP